MESRAPLEAHQKCLLQHQSGHRDHSQEGLEQGETRGMGEEHRLNVRLKQEEERLQDKPQQNSDLKVTLQKAEEEGREGTACDSAQKQGPLPPDGGWGWAVAVGAAFVAMLVPTLSLSFGILFSPQLLQWRASSTTVAVIYTGFLVGWRCAGIVVGTLTKEFGFRKVAMTGTLTTAASLACSAFVTSPELLFVTFSLGCGVGCGLSCVDFLILSHYFKKRRGLANAFLNAGLGLGSFLGPLLSQFLQGNYGSRGAVLVLGAVVLHSFLASTLYQPVEWHMRQSDPPVAPPPHQVGLLQPSSSDSHDREVAHSYKVKYREEEVSLDVLPVTIHPHRLNGDEQMSRHSSCSSVVSKRVSLASLDLASMASVASLELAANTDLPDDAPESELNVYRKDAHKSKLGQTVTRLLCALARDMAILKRPPALIIALASTLINSGQAYFMMLVPFAVQAAGHSIQTAAWCVSIHGVINFLARMLSSSLSDFPWFNMRLCYMLSLFTIATSIVLFPFQTQSVGLAAVMGLSGIAAGVVHGLNNLYMVSIVGLDNLHSMFGSRSLMAALGFCTIGPLIGAVRDASGSYAVSLWVAAGFVYTSFILWLLMPKAVAYDQRKRPCQTSSA